jgi:hypothetical protein
MPESVVVASFLSALCHSPLRDQLGRSTRVKILAVAKASAADQVIGDCGHSNERAGRGQHTPTHWAGTGDRCLSIRRQRPKVMAVSILHLLIHDLNRWLYLDRTITNSKM